MKSANLLEFIIMFNELTNQPELFEDYVFRSIESKIKIRQHEMECLKGLISHFDVRNVAHFDNFYISYSIPQIGKEFDLLRISQNSILNIETKSQYKSDKELHHQVMLNFHYLKCFEKKIHIFIYVHDTSSLMYLDDSLQLVRIDFDFLEGILIDTFQSSCDYSTGIDQYFKISDILVSPLNSTDKFLKNQYFLTNHQEERKKSIFKAFQTFDTVVLQASAGTGKTLLIFDIARELSNKGKKICVVHVGLLCPGHESLNNSLKNVSVIPVRVFNSFDYSTIDYVLIDESQRLKLTQISLIKQLQAQYRFKLYISLDQKQVLSYSEEASKVLKYFENMTDAKVFTMSGKIRTNIEISSFILGLFDLSKFNQSIGYKSVDLLYSSSFEHLRLLIEIYIQKGYRFINYTPSTIKIHFVDRFQTKVTSHSVIGQEFDKVVTFLLPTFSYSNGVLEAGSAPYHEHKLTKLLYQIVTRCRTNLAIIIFKNQSLFSELIGRIAKRD